MTYFSARSQCYFQPNFHTSKGMNPTAKIHGENRRFNTPPLLPCRRKFILLQVEFQILFLLKFTSLIKMNFHYLSTEIHTTEYWIYGCKSTSSALTRLLLLSTHSIDAQFQDKVQSQPNHHCDCYDFEFLWKYGGCELEVILYLHVWIGLMRGDYGSSLCLGANSRVWQLI